MTNEDKDGFNEYGFKNLVSGNLSKVGFRITLYDGSKNERNKDAKPDVRFATLQLSQFNKKAEGYDNVNLGLNDLRLLQHELSDWIATLEECEKSQA